MCIVCYVVMIPLVHSFSNTLPKLKMMYDFVEKMTMAIRAWLGPTTKWLMMFLTKASNVIQLSLPTLPDESSRKTTSTAPVTAEENGL